MRFSTTLCARVIHLFLIRLIILIFYLQIMDTVRYELEWTFWKKEVVNEHFD